LGEGGELSVVIPFDCKTRLETEATLAGFSLVRTCAVRTTPTKPPRRFLLAFQKHPSPLQTEELVIGSDTYKELTKAFYLH
jgi:tRNA1Val (adenine37-N6)-methyltransferase